MHHWTFLHLKHLLLEDLLSFSRCSICSISYSCSLCRYASLISKLLWELMSLSPLIYTVFEMGITLLMKYCVGLWVLYLLQFLFYFSDLNCCCSIYPGYNEADILFRVVIKKQYKHFFGYCFRFQWEFGIYIPINVVNGIVWEKQFRS
jgi:hypothetical protein